MGSQVVAMKNPRAAAATLAPSASISPNRSIDLQDNIRSERRRWTLDLHESGLGKIGGVGG